MHSVSAARPVSPQPSQQSQISSRGPTLKKKIRNVRGIGAALKDSSGAFSDQLSHSWTVGRDSLPLNRKSTGTSTEARKSSSRRRKHRVQQSTATEIQFFETEPADSPSIAEKSEPFVVVDNMMNWDAPYTRQSRRPPVRMDAQDGPWSVSVAETPYDPHSYSLYIKSMSHLCDTATVVLLSL
jgi:serum/glucocorticoid-regulated kinase 2